MQQAISRGFVFLLVAIMPLAAPLRADATLRYHTDIQTSAFLPAASLDQALGGIRDMVIRIKGNKAYSSQGNLSSIMDLMTQDLTLVDAAHKRFATVPASQYAEQVKTAVPAVPDQARAALASMKTNLESRLTGRTATIQGIEAEEHEFVLTMEMPLPGAPQFASPLMKMVMQVWTAKPEEAQRVPALQEFKNYMASANSAMNPAEMIKQVLSGLPGMSDNLGTMFAELTKNGAMSLRMHTELFMPFLAIMAQQLPGQAPPAGLDPNAALIQMNQEVVELSTSPVDDSLFQVPADYEPASLEEILKGAVSAAALPQFKQ
jgi:hypothetical protein